MFCCFSEKFDARPLNCDIVMAFPTEYAEALAKDGTLDRSKAKLNFSSRRYVNGHEACIDLDGVLGNAATTTLTTDDSKPAFTRTMLRRNRKSTPEISLTLQPSESGGEKGEDGGYELVVTEDSSRSVLSLFALNCLPSTVCPQLTQRTPLVSPGRTTQTPLSPGKTSTGAETRTCPGAQARRQSISSA
mgnify:CR=1 FL=1